MVKSMPRKRKVYVYELSTTETKISEMPSIMEAAAAFKVSRQTVYHSAKSQHVIVDLKKGTKLLFRFKQI